MSLPVVLAVCGDPGGAGALAPVVRRLLGDQRVAVRSLAYGSTTEALSAADAKTRTLPDSLSDADLERVLDGAALVLAGTSGPNAQDYERRLVALAGARGLPTAMIIDFWSNYEGRFKSAPGKPVAHPDRLFAIDERMRLGLIEAGVPADCVRVVGHPGFDSILHTPKLDAAAWQRVRAAHGAGGCDKLVLFVANPDRVRAASSESPASAAGQREALETLANLLQAISARRGFEIALAIRPHPREPHPAFVPASRAGVRVFLGAPAGARDAVLASDAVVGITTMLLIEACLLRRPVVALRIAEPDTHAYALPPFVLRATNSGELERFLERAFEQDAASDCTVDAVLLRGDATEAVVRDIYSLLAAVTSPASSQVQKAHREV